MVHKEGTEMRASPFLLAPALLLAVALSAAAHVPYLEEEDYSLRRPFLNLDVTQSIALYSWLESADDVDIHMCWVPEPSRFFAELLVPVCAAYESFFPWFAVIGPGLPTPSSRLLGPYRLSIIPWREGGAPRETFYEPFGGKSYYQGPTFDRQVTKPGLYFIFVWDPKGTVGDYVLPIGKEERWPPADIKRALIETPKIRRNEELHIPCK